MKVSPENEKQRHIDRDDQQSDKWLQTRRTLISNLQTNFMIMNTLQIRQTDTSESIEKLKQEIEDILK
mgnify:CR=1 FL=1